MPDPLRLQVMDHGHARHGQAAVARVDCKDRETTHRPPRHAVPVHVRPGRASFQRHPAEILAHRWVQVREVLEPIAHREQNTGTRGAQRAVADVIDLCLCRLFLDLSEFRLKFRLAAWWHRPQFEAVVGPVLFKAVLVKVPEYQLEATIRVIVTQRAKFGGGRVPFERRAVRPLIVAACARHAGCVAPRCVVEDRALGGGWEARGGGQPRWQLELGT